MLQNFGKARSSGGRIFEVIERQPAIDPEADGATPSQVTGELQLENVSFTYPARPDVPIFTNFSLHVPAGKTVALVGSSGSGKSTVVGLIERYYDPLSGRVLLDGVDIRSLKLSWLRSQVTALSWCSTMY